MQKYKIAIDFIEPIGEYQSLASKAPGFILESLNDCFGNRWSP